MSKIILRFATPGGYKKKTVEYHKAEEPKEEAQQLETLFENT